MFFAKALKIWPRISFWGGGKIALPGVGVQDNSRVDPAHRQKENLPIQ
jgi:hypothetical protein